MKKLLFIYPTMITEAPMTLAMLSSVAKQEGWNTKACINTFKRPLTIEDFVFSAKKYGADLVGISMITFEVLFVYKLVKSLKDAGFKVIIGGSHPTDVPEECIKYGADVVIVGEGEYVLRDILKEWPDVKTGIRERKPYIKNLDDLSLPDLDIFDINDFGDKNGFIKGFHRIYTSRGCPSFCTFCDWQVFKQEWRVLSVKKIIEDIRRRSEKYDLNSFAIADDCFTVDHKRVYEFCNEIVKITPKIEWRASSRANLVNAELLKAMREANCFSIAFGLESGDAETLKKTAKSVTLEENIRGPWLAHEAGLEVYGCLMTGFPWETTQSIQNQIDLIHKTWDAVSLFQVSGSLMPFPGTAIYKKYAKEYGFEKYWLNPKYQQYGIQVYQNALNPLKSSNFYQRYLFDDTYIKEETFFKYSPEYKNKIKELVIEIGRHNLLFMFPNQKIKQKYFFQLSKASMLFSNIFPGLEKKIGGFIFDILSKNKRTSIENLRDNRRGIVKKRKPQKKEIDIKAKNV
ncbi:MAG: radical SAM protein [Bacteroidales bacterium]|jgi:radical SAM superfamily enzyme YgiQ (UPF0313 family)